MIPEPHWAPEPTLPRTKRPLPPRQDPFYVAPAGFEALAPGTLLRSREVQVALVGLVPQRLSAWQLLYRTQNLHGVPEATVTTVILPAGEPDGDSRDRPLLAYQCAIDSITDRGAPSYALQRGVHALGAQPTYELLLIAGALRRGWVVSVADHGGLTGWFGAPREPGYRSLDGVRAALAFEPLGLHADTKVGALGYSGGGMASSWLAEMAPEYAPEINLVGAALGAPVGDPGETFLKLNGGHYAGLPALVVAALRHAYPGLGRVVKEHATFEGMQRLRQLEKLSTVGAIVRFRKNDFDDFLDAPLADVLAEPDVLDVFSDIRLGNRTPQCPVFVLQAVHDPIISVEDVDGQVERYVAGGADVTYVRDRMSDHLFLYIIGFPAMIDWIEDRFEGKKAKPGSRTVRSVGFSLRSLKGYAAMGLSALRVVLGRP